MTNLYIYCEGQTEESFINHVLRERLTLKGIYTTPIIATTKRTGSRKHSGGTVPYSKMRAEIKNLCANKNYTVTTMFDFYALPQDIPGKRDPIGSTIYEVAGYIESEWFKDIDEPNFIPNIIMHEFEGLLFSCPNKFAYVNSRPMKLKEMQDIRTAFETPEHINNSIDTAPSKRILSIFPDYAKVLHGTQIALEIGCGTMIEQCKHFSDWVQKLEALSQ